MKMKRSILWFALLGAIVLLGGVGGWYLWRRAAAPVPPEVSLTDADPALVKAVGEARDQVLQHPYSVTSWGQLGKLLSAEEHKTEAVRCFAEAERLEPNNPRWPYLWADALLPRDPDAALPHLERAAALCSRSDADNIVPLLRLAELLLDQQRNDEAALHLHRALEQEPDNPSIQLDLGILALARGALDESKTHLLRCQHSPFTQQKACAQLAEVHQRLGDATAAAEYGQRAASLPHDAHWIDPYVREYLQMAVGKPSRFRTVERLEGQGNLPEAVAELQEILVDGPDYRAYVGLGKDLAQMGNATGAEQAFRAAMKLTPENAQAYYQLSKLLWAQAEQRWKKESERPQALEQFRSAADLARQALARKSDHALAHMYLGLSLKYLGQHEDAMASFRTASRCSPELADPHLHAGELLLEDGKEDEARRELELAAQLAKPDDPRPRAALARLGKH
jgi:tetratricopeptide (TPR) repeat protein